MSKQKSNRRELTAEEALETMRAWAQDMHDQAAQTAETTTDVNLIQFEFGRAAAYRAIGIAITEDQKQGFSRPEQRVKDLEAELKEVRALLATQAEIGALQNARIIELEGLLLPRSQETLQ